MRFDGDERDVLAGAFDYNEAAAKGQRVQVVVVIVADHGDVRLMAVLVLVLVLVLVVVTTSEEWQLFQSGEYHLGEMNEWGLTW
jgi:hypothetical protein